MSDCETHSWPNTLRLMAHTLPFLKISITLLYLSMLVLPVLVPDVLHALKGPVHGEPLLDGFQVMPERSWSNTAITSIPDATEQPVHLLITPKVEGFLHYHLIPGHPLYDHNINQEPNAGGDS